MEALSLYAKLMNEDPVYAMYAKLQSQQYYMQQPASAAQQVRATGCQSHSRSAQQHVAFGRLDDASFCFLESKMHLWIFFFSAWMLVLN